MAKINPPESITLPKPQLTLWVNGSSVFMLVEFAGCYIIEFGPAANGPWTQEGGVHTPGEAPLEVPANEFVTRYYRVRGVPCEVPADNE